MARMRMEILTTPKRGLTKDDVLGAAVSAAETVDRASARQYRGGQVSIILVAETLDVETITREVGYVSLSRPEVTVR
jgi:hypothetical protein